MVLPNAAGRWVQLLDSVSARVEVCDVAPATVSAGRLTTNAKNLVVTSHVATGATPQGLAAKQSEDGWQQELMHRYERRVGTGRSFERWFWFPDIFLK